MSRDHVDGGVVGNITVTSVPLIHVRSKTKEVFLSVGDIHSYHR